MEFVIYALKNIFLMYFKPGEQKIKLRPKRNQYIQSNLNLSRWLAIPRRTIQRSSWDQSQAKRPEGRKQFLIFFKIERKNFQLGFKKNYRRRLWMNILTVASFPLTHPPTHFLGTPETSCDLIWRGLSIETMPCCAGSEGTFETQKKGRYPYRPQKIESVARSNKTKQQPPSPMSRCCRGWREHFPKKIPGVLDLPGLFSWRDRSRTNP